MSNQHSDTDFDLVGLNPAESAGLTPALSRLRSDGLQTASLGFKVLLGVLIAVGLIARAAPFLDIDNRLLEQFVTEDGYFMLAIARNLAIGNGFSIADGEMPTNGTQPLTTLLFTLGYLVVGGAKKAGVGIAQGIQFIAAIAAAWFLYRLGLKALARRSDAPYIAALAAATWFASPLTLPHSMNGLETGIYALVAILVALRFVEDDVSAERPWTLPQCLVSGFLLGVAFWTRNDAAFLILAACLTYLYSGVHLGLGAVGARFARALVFGATSILVASPWLGFNYSLFGHIVPVSGRAESLTAELFHNVLEVPPVLLEYFAVFIPIPQVYEQISTVAAACIIPLLAIVVTLPWVWGIANRTERRLMLLVMIYGTGLSAFYGLYFGAGWFMARYLFPLSPFLALLWATWVMSWLVPRMRSIVLTGLAGVMVSLVVAQNVRWYRAGDRHPHFQVIEWADSNIPKTMWTGAIQTGTLGYFHNRTVNLDGKVNIDAYHATKNDRSGPYVITTDIEYLLDWTGMAEWLTKPAIEADFRVIVLDYDQELAVLQRRDRIRLGAFLAFDQDAAMIAHRQTTNALKNAVDDATKWALTYQLARLEDAIEDEENAEDVARQALALAEKHSRAEQPGAVEWRSREVESRRLLATVLRIRHKLDEATTMLEQAIARYPTIDGPAARRDLALTMVAHAELIWESGDPKRADARYREALALQDQLLAAGEPVARDRAVTLLALGDLATERGELDKAKTLFRDSWNIRKKLYEVNKNRRTTYDYALAEARLGRLAHLEGRFDEAEQRINESIRLRRSLPKPHPGRAEPEPKRTIQFNEGLLGISTFDVPKLIPERDWSKPTPKRDRPAED